MNISARLLFLVAILFFTSCRNDLETADWNVDVLAPILVSDLDIGDLAGDSNLTTQPDSSLVLVYRSELASFGLPDLIDPFTYTHYEYLSLDSLDLSDIIVPSSISLGQIADNAGIVGQIIIGNNGSSMVIPSLGNIPGASTPIDASQYFESISLIGGILEVTIENGLPIAIEDFAFGILNSSNMQVLIQDTFDYIAAGATASSSSSLAGKTIESQLLAELYGMSSPGSNGQSVLIDTSDALVITLTIRDLKPSSATTIWPAQNIINDTSEVFLEGSEGLELTFGIIRSGDINMDISSTINDDIQFEYIIPESDLNGAPFAFQEGVPAAPPGGVSTIIKNYDFAGIELNLTGRDHDIFNTFYHIILGQIDFTGQIVTLSLEDSVVVELGMTDLTVDYAVGDLGNETLQVGPESTFFPGLSRLVSGTVGLEQTSASLEVHNPIGAGALFTLDQVQGINSRNNQEVPLNLNPGGNMIQIGPATESAGSVFATNEVLLLNENNSNINAFLANLPDQITFEGHVIINPAGPHIGFIYYDHPLQAFLNLEVPLHLVANSLTLVDTTDFNLGNAPEWDQIKGGEIRLLISNGLPFEANIEVMLLDIDGDILETILPDEVIEAPQLNARPESGRAGTHNTHHRP